MLTKSAHLHLSYHAQLKSVISDDSIEHATIFLKVRLGSAYPYPSLGCLSVSNKNDLLITSGNRADKKGHMSLTENDAKAE